MNFFNKLKNIFFSNPADEELEEEEMDRNPDNEEKSGYTKAREEDQDRSTAGQSLFRDKRGENARESKTLSMPNNKRVGAIIFHPTSYDDSPNIADRLRENQMVILNFEETDNVLAKRMTDFISGTIYALGGSMRKIGHKILICAPKNIDIDAEANLYEGKDGQSWKN